MSDQGPYPGYPGPDPDHARDPGQQQPQQPATYQPPQYPQAPAQGHPQGHPQGYPQQPPYGYGYPPAGSSGERPGKLTAAAVITWIGAGLMLCLFVLVLLGGFAVPQDELEKALRDELDGQQLPFSMDQLRSGLVISGLIGAAWCAAACVFAGMMLKRQNAARILLAISAGATILFSLVGIAAIIPLLFAGAAIAVLVLVFSKESNAWFRGESAATPSYQPYPPQQPQPPQQPPGSGSSGPW